jgi:hypothetical protein
MILHFHFMTFLTVLLFFRFLKKCTENSLSHLKINEHKKHFTDIIQNHISSYFWKNVFDGKVFNFAKILYIF